MKNLILGVSLFALAIFTSACGNYTTHPAATGSSSAGLSTGTIAVATNTGVSSGTSGLAPAEQCSEAANVTSTGLNDSITSEYHACSATASATNNVRVFNEDQTVKNICVFAANQASGQVSPFVTDPYAAIENVFAVQCSSVNSVNGASFSFPNLNFNAVYIVDQANVQAMATCLEYSQISACAANYGFTYSYGQFR